ncbi:sulfite exporter TauE/SafE family protein [Geosporobacter ferrireducens]|uniref:Probable membrane transporter protein n=1 Tax=Geosporobacter ferrireducens TaxID=1424294 RepID=A0A1D8GCH0_9FIRM|nr:sulfite exporter TauE/SafE family protein [Geosporobacter ferrireducens]AOT68601.1 permease [Geosporobacter ferrireducens]MTI54070.1 sulfite exporter TauE/SafE family protein [Geosporobacter ferrireducens]
MEKPSLSFKIILLGLITGMINGLFGAGGGTILVPGMFFLLGVSQHKAHATAIAIILPLTLVSAFIYVKHGIIAWDVTLKVILGGVVGSYIGARLFARISDNLLRKAFGVFMIIAAIRMVF